MWVLSSTIHHNSWDNFFVTTEYFYLGISVVNAMRQKYDRLYWFLSRSIFEPKLHRYFKDTCLYWITYCSLSSNLQNQCEESDWKLSEQCAEELWKIIQHTNILKKIKEKIGTSKYPTSACLVGKYFAWPITLMQCYIFTEFVVIFW